MDVTKLYDLTVNYKTDPIGIEMDNIRFSWKMRSGVIGQMQKWYRITVSEAMREASCATKNDIIWDSGETSCGLSVAIPYGGPHLKLQTRYLWEVTVGCINGELCIGSAFFETGADWNGVDWITIDGYNENIYSLAFRTQQELTGTDISSARLYITAAGAYQAYINGRNVQPEGKNAIMAPGWTDVLRYINYQSYDVTGYISDKYIALGVLVGNGWYGTIGGGMGGSAFTGENGEKTYITETVHSFLGDRTEEAPLREKCILVKLVINYNDGTSQCIMSGADDWIATEKTPLGRNGVTSFEEYDARKNIILGNWTAAGYKPDKSLWTGTKKIVYKGTLNASDDGAIYEYRAFDWIDAYSYLDWDTTVETTGGSFMDPGVTTFMINKLNDILPGDKYTNASHVDKVSKYRTGEIDPEKITKYTPGNDIILKNGHTLVLDFGQNAAYIPYLEISGSNGTVLDILPGENISDGNSNVMLGVAGWNPEGEPIPKGVVNHKGGAGKNKYYKYTLSGDDTEVYKSQFTFIGWRYLAITATGGDVIIKKVQSIAVSSVGAETGFIETSNDLLNRFISNSKWSQIGNFNSVPTDCPTREYNGWTGDIQVFAETGMYHFDSVRLLGNYIEIMQEGHRRMGTYHQIMPSTVYSSQDSPGWTDAGVIVPWTYFMQTGDTGFIKKYWDVMCAYTDRLNETSGYGDNWESAYDVNDERGFGPAEPGAQNTGWSDHLGLYIPSGQFTATIYHLIDNMLMYKLAEMTENPKDAERYKKHADMIKNYMKKRYISDNGDVLSGSIPDEVIGMKGFPWQPYIHIDNAQTALAWMLKLGVYDTEEQRDIIAGNLSASIQNKDTAINPLLGENTIAAGFLGVHVLLPALSQNGHSKTAYSLMTNTNENTFLYAVAKPPEPATTIWEEWVIWGPSENQGWGRGSQNHYSYGASSLWLYEYVLGIAKDENCPGFKNFILQPTPDVALDYAKGSYESYYGKIKSVWTACCGKITGYECSVPANTTAVLYLPVDESFTKNLINGDTQIEGVTYYKQESRNGAICAVFNLSSGSYSFDMTKEDIKIMSKEDIKITYCT